MFWSRGRRAYKAFWTTRPFWAGAWSAHLAWELHSLQFVFLPVLHLPSSQPQEPKQLQALVIMLHESNFVAFAAHLGIVEHSSHDTFLPALHEFLDQPHLSIVAHWHAVVARLHWTFAAHFFWVLHSLQSVEPPVTHMFFLLQPQPFLAAQAQGVVPAIAQAAGDGHLPP